MLRGFLKELGNVALNRATNKINTQINKQLGSGVGLPTSRRGGVDQSAYAKLNGRFRGQAIAYPEDLGSIDQGHYVQFFMKEQVNAKMSYNAGGSGKISKRTHHPDFSDFAPSTNGYSSSGGANSTLSVRRVPRKRTESSIAMYMPATVAVQTAMAYGETELGSFASSAVEGAKGVAREGFIDGLIKGGALKNTNFVQDLKDAATGAAKTAGGTVATAAQIASGKVFNNRLEMIFQGINRREFSFSFKCMPKSESEAVNVKKIAEMFRFYMSPSFAGDMNTSRVFNVPATFEIQFCYGQGQPNGFLHRIGECVLTQCNITYGGERVQFYRPTSDGAPPVETQIDLTFKELEIMTREKVAMGH